MEAAEKPHLNLHAVRRAWWMGRTETETRLYTLRACLQGSGSSIQAAPSKGATLSPNSAPTWEPSMQTPKPMRADFSCNPPHDETNKKR